MLQDVPTVLGFPPHKSRGFRAAREQRGPSTAQPRPLPSGSPAGTSRKPAAPRAPSCTASS